MNTFCCKIDPVSLYGEGLFNLNSVKYISVTDSFLGLDRAVKKCQSIETIDNCKTRLYTEKMRKNCGCMPLSLRLSEKVFLMIFAPGLGLKRHQETSCLSRR